MKIRIYLCLALLVVSCGDATFKGSGTIYNDGGSSSDTVAQGRTSPEAQGDFGSGEDFDPSSPENSESPQNSSPENQPEGNTPPEAGADFSQGFGDSEYYKNCWFAVSGNWIGRDPGIFPLTKEYGDDIRPGATFNNSGGVFLAARDKPYVHGEKGTMGSITQAVNGTFDSIVVSPYMRVTIRNRAGRVLLNQVGPIIAITTGHLVTPRSEIARKLKANPNIKGWLREHLESRPEPVEVIPGLHASHSVKVSFVNNTKCDRPEMYVP